MCREDSQNVINSSIKPKRLIRNLEVSLCIHVLLWRDGEPSISWLSAEGQAAGGLAAFGSSESIR